MPGAGHRDDDGGGRAAVGAFATNVIGKRLLQRGEGYLLRVPVFRTIYAPVKQLVVGVFAGQRVRVQARGDAVEDKQGYALGFLTKEFTVDRGQRAGVHGGGLRAD